MVQAKRRSPSKSGANHRPSFHGLGMLLAGMVIGALATILWQGMQAEDGGVGTGIRQMLNQFKQQHPESMTEQVESEQDTLAKRQTNFDFYTVLPEIEVVVPSVESDSSLSISQTNEVGDDTNASAYMLQAGAYKNQADADRLKAELAFQGLVSTIQKISIQDRGDFYRVRLGPYISYDQMAAADQKLARQGITALRLKISKGG
ncbi:SPOR domain-containing protein [Candidatus Spongiihabitans sp.]|uniref:SPOR domain-containing protein n=1 Tax=Candidatus Spongiihabitans sp. TaxID=3101308 RepID=UPI003C6F9DAC